MMTPAEFSRFYRILRVFLSHGLDELIPKNRLGRPFKWSCRMMFWIRNQYPDKQLGERLRLALQSLGPVWVKFGQMMSTRRDLLPADIADQMALLQDQVAPFDGKLARQLIEKAMGGPLEQWFDDFDETALASASIAQVHTACLKKNGKQVVIKVIRPDILPVIKADIRLMYRFASWVPKLLPNGQRLRPLEVVREYEKTLLDELNLMREAANAIQLRRNFHNSPLLYVPEVYSDYCRDSVMVMERIYGIPVSDVEALKAHGINMQLLAERGLQVFFTQVFRDSFFHADMHPGNIFVNYQHPEDPQYIGIDYGIVGSLNKEDKRYLAENLLAFFNRDYLRVAELHVDSGWVPSDTNIEDFEFAIRTVCEPIFEKPLSEISYGHVLMNLFNTARRFSMEVQPQLVLLQKTLLYVEGLGRQLYPQLDLWTTAKPFLEQWMLEQVGFAAALRKLKSKVPFLAETLPDLPELLYNSLRQHHKLQNSVDTLIVELKQQNQQQNRSYYLLGVGAILLLSATLLHINHVDIWPFVLAGGGVISWWIGWKKAV